MSSRLGLTMSFPTGNKNFFNNPLYNFTGKPPPPILHPVVPSDVCNPDYLTELYAPKKRQIGYNSISRRRLTRLPSTTRNYSGRRSVIRKDEKSHLFNQLLIGMVCLAGCILQIWWLSAPTVGGYFAYDVVTSVTVAYKEKLQYPTRTYCFWTVDIVDWNEILKNQDVKAESASSSMLKFRSMSAEDLATKARAAKSYMEKLQLDTLVKQSLPAKTLLSITFDANDIFELCSYITRVNYTAISAKCDEVYDIRKFLLKSYTCFELDPKKHREYELSSVQLVYGYNPGMVSAIAFKSPFYDHVKQSLLYVHDPKELPSTQNPRSIVISDMNRLFQVTYVEYESSFLPKPYPSNCKNYTKEGFGTRVNCINTCTAKRSVELLKYNSLLVPVTQVPMGTPKIGLDAYLDFKVLSDLQVLANQSMFNASRDISRSCNKLCSHIDCDDINIAPVLLSGNSYPFNLYTFHLSYEPDVKTATVEKLGITSFLSDVASALGFWLGISLLSSLEYTSRIVGKIISK